jgi:hypothetical protein
MPANLTTFAHFSVSSVMFCQNRRVSLRTRRWTLIADERLSFELLFDEAFVVVAGAQNQWVRRR